MEYGPENNVFVLKMMMKSGVEKIILKSLLPNNHAANLIIFLEKKPPKQPY